MKKEFDSVQDCPHILFKTVFSLQSVADSEMLPSCHDPCLLVLTCLTVLSHWVWTGPGGLLLTSGIWQRDVMAVPRLGYVFDETAAGWHTHSRASACLLEK